MRFAIPLTMLGLILTGCAGTQRVTPIEVWQDMKRDGKYLPQTESSLFSDHRASRAPVAHTVARGHLNEDEFYTTGIVPGTQTYGGVNPLAINAELLQTGQMKFNTYCSPCHSRVGNGKGIVALKTPSWQPSNLHDDRIKQMADGEIFNVISYGKRSMPSYRYQVPEHDRWAIVAYVRALQRTSSGSAADVPSQMQAELK